MENELSPKAREEMRKSVGWMRFYAVIIFIIVAFMLLLGVRLMIVSNAYMNTGVLGGVLILIALFMGIMGYFLFVTTNHISNAEKSGTFKDVETGFASYKTFFIVWGVFVILSVIFSLFEIITGL